jgi:uncharacterized membrane protein YfhO
MAKTIRAFIRTKFYLLVAFVLPALILGGVYASLGVFPYGHRTILAMDMYGQYMNFYEALRRDVFSGGSLFYSWSKSLGGNMVGLESYYLASPFSLIALLFPDKYLIEAMIAMTLAKAGCAGMAMALYLHLSKGATRTSALVFSIPYALLSYLSGYSYNLMWLDGMVFLPFIALGIERIASGKQSGFYLAALTVMLISNYYIGYMLCLFAVIYMIYCLFLFGGQMPFRTIARRTGIFLAASLAAAGLAAFLLVPTYYSLKTGKLDFDPNFMSLVANFSLLDLPSKLLIGSYHSAFAVQPPPPIYCGLAMGLLAGVFFTSSRIGARRKVLAGILFVVLLGSMYVKAIDLIWHGLQLANGFPYRYAFLFGFVCISLAYDAYSEGPAISGRFFAIAAGMALSCVLYVWVSGKADISRTAILLSLGFILGYLILLYFWKRTGPAAIYILGSLILMEATLNSLLMIRAVDNEFHFPDRVAYSRPHYQVQDVLDRLSAEDPGFYRLEKTFNRSYNDPLESSYRGISHFSSLFDSNLQTFLSDIGFQRSFYRLLYVGATPPADSILGVKYLLSTIPLDNGYEQVDTYPVPNGQIYTYRNPNALPLGFLVDGSLAGADLEGGNPIHFQDRIVQAMLGANGQTCFSALKMTRVNVQNLLVEEGAAGFRFSKLDPAQSASIELHYTSDSDGPLYAYLASPMNHDKVEVKWDEESLGFYGEFREFSNLLSLGRPTPGADLRLRLGVSWDKLVLYNPQLVYQLDEDCYAKQFAELAQNPWRITNFSDTTVHGTITGAGQKPLLFTSIPYDPGWTVRLDGKVIQKVRLLDTFIGVEIPPGTHQLDFDYTPPGLILGCTISGFTVFGGLILFAVRRSSKRKGV